MKKFGLLTGLVIFCALGPMQSASYAQPTATAAQLEAIVKPTLDSCSAPTVQMTSASATSSRVNATRINPARVVPAGNRRAIPSSRVAKTLHGIWRGEVQGDTSDLNVDYFWIIDTTLNEALIVAQRSGKNSVGPSQLANPPKLTYLMCAHDGYSPGTSVPQIHEFTKVSTTTNDAARIVQTATGVKSDKANPTPTDLWQALLASKYFDGLPYVAFAGALFKPIRIEQVRSGSGPAEVFVGWDAEYRGGGSTKIKYTTGLPLFGKERAQFVGAGARSGDYLVSSPGNGAIYKVEMIEGYEAYYDLAFDSVSLGPLE